MGILDADMLSKLKLVRCLKMHINYLINCRAPIVSRVLVFQKFSCLVLCHGHVHTL